MREMVGTMREEMSGEAVMGTEMQRIRRVRGSIKSTLAWYGMTFLCTFMNIEGLQAEPPFYQDHARGWYWYEDPESLEPGLEAGLETGLEAVLEPRVEPRVEPGLREDPKQKSGDPAKPPSSFSPQPQPQPSPKTAVERLKDVQVHLAELKAKAILEPTSQNVKSYQDMQMKVMNQSQEFSRAWVMNVFMNPSLDENIKNPSAQSARFVVYENDRKRTESIIHTLKDTYGLFYFYSGSCAYCRAFSPIVKLFSDKYGWSVMAISLDGSPSDTFPHWQMDNGLSAHWDVQAIPAVFAINPETNHVIPVANGFTALDEMEKRLVTIVQHEEGVGADRGMDREKRRGQVHGEKGVSRS